jgi:hypothetical protein
LPVSSLFFFTVLEQTRTNNRLQKKKDWVQAFYFKLSFDLQILFFPRYKLLINKQSEERQMGPINGKWGKEKAKLFLSPRTVPSGLKLTR